MNLAWRRLSAMVVVAAVVMLGGCGGNRGVPPQPAPTKAWTRMWPDQAVRQVKFEYPANWRVEVNRRHGGSVTVKATDAEWWRLQYNPEHARTPLEQFAAAVRADRASRRGDILTSNLTPVTIADLEGIRLDYEVLAEKVRGMRFVLDGGWVIEYEMRDAHRAVVDRAFQHLTSSVDLTENR